MVKHNNIIPNAHFHKQWERFVKTWFDQPAKKIKRRERRAAKAAAIFPRPAKGLLRPVVHAPTIRYNRKTRYGRGFSLAELRSAKINKRTARQVGIAVDYRRRNKTDASLRANAKRLRQYKSKLIVFPKKAAKPKKGDSPKEELAKATQLKTTVLPLRKPSTAQTGSRPIKEGEKHVRVFAALRKARADARLVGIRKKKAAEKAEKKAATVPK